MGPVGGDADAGIRHGPVFPRLSDLGRAAYAGIGTLVAHLIGWRLIPLQFTQQRYESDFRFAIARGTDHSEPVALMQGEAVEREEMRTASGSWCATGPRWCAPDPADRLHGGYAQASTVVPMLMVSPAYLAGAIPLGSLMQAALAFQRVEGAFAFCIGAYPKIAEWKAMMDRLAQFEAAMVVVDRARPARARSRSSGGRPRACDRQSRRAAARAAGRAAPICR